MFQVNQDITPEGTSKRESNKDREKEELEGEQRAPRRAKAATVSKS